jgi:hypothetical protein
MSALFLIPQLSQAQTKSPEEVVGTRPNNLAQLPPGWVTSHPIRLLISFNLKSAPNSPQADAFMTTLRQALVGSPGKPKLEVYRQITPPRFSYVASLTFKDWPAYQAHETSEAFLAYYRASWKPEVTEAEEQLSVLDEATSDRRL